MAPRAPIPPALSGSPRSAVPAGLFPPSSGGGIHPDDASDRHRPIAAEACNKFLNDLADQPRFVTVGLRLAAHPGFGTIDIPMIFFPVHGAR